MNFYQLFFDADVSWKILIYSGDIDISSCPPSYAQLCLADLARPVIKKWRSYIQQQIIFLEDLLTIDESVVGQFLGQSSLGEARKII